MKIMPLYLAGKHWCTVFSLLFFCRFSISMLMLLKFLQLETNHETVWWISAVNKVHTTCEKGH